MKSMKAALWGVVVILIAVVGGFFLYRSTSPRDDLAPSGTPVLHDNSRPNSQFLQMQPSGEPGVDKKEKAVNDVSGETMGLPPGADKEEKAAEDKTGIAEPTVTVNVSITDSGFVPDEVTVSLGTSVVFTNDGQALHWPASDVHPTHELLAGFDARRGLATGEEYSFVFTEPGVWQYHDHLFPNLKGAVVVR